MNTEYYVDDCIAFLKKLIETPSVNGKDNEAAIAAVVAEEAERLGLPCKIIAKDSGRPNIFVGEGFEDNGSLLLVAHLDTVPTGDPATWSFDPFAATIQDGRLYGRGAFDCKGGIALGLYVLKALVDRGELRAAKFVGVADEESGADSSLGLRYVLDQGLAARGAVYAYGITGHERIIIGHRGLVRLWVACKGEAAHSGSSEWANHTKGASAIDGIVDFLVKIRSFTLPGDNKYFPNHRFTLTPTLLDGGSGESLVPDTAKVLLDIRTLPEHSNDYVIESITSIANELTTDKLSFSVDVKNSIPGVVTDPVSPFVQQARRLSKQLFGVSPVPEGSGPANEGYMLVSRGIPTIIGYGPVGGNFHAANEYIELNSIGTSLEFLIRLALEH